MEGLINTIKETNSFLSLLLLSPSLSFQDREAIEITIALNQIAIIESEVFSEAS